MSQVIKYYCDAKGCKSERAGNESIRVYSHSTRDASGMNHHWLARFDLCAKCLLNFTDALIDSMEHRGRIGQRTPFKIVQDWEIKYELL